MNANFKLFHAQNDNCQYNINNNEIHLSFIKNCTIVNSQSAETFQTNCTPTNTSYCPGVNRYWIIEFDGNNKLLGSGGYVIVAEPTILGFRKNTNDSLYLDIGPNPPSYPAQPHVFMFTYNTSSLIKSRYYIANNYSNLYFQTDNVTSNPGEIVGWSVKFYIDKSPHIMNTGYVDNVQLYDAKLIPSGSGIAVNFNETNQQQLDVFYNGPLEVAQYFDVFNAPTFDYRYYMG
uniref:Uncharacterized protein n=1 Tax=Acrobeloides nanus TaxID=290746 RepID=A0A914CVF7_9BILA